MPRQKPQSATRGLAFLDIGLNFSLNADAFINNAYLVLFTVVYVQ